MTKASQWAAYVPSMADTAASNGKHLMVEEWGVGTGSDYDSVGKQAKVFNDAGVPWLYWMIIPGKSVDEGCDGSKCCHQGLSTKANEAFEVGVSSSRADFKGLIGTAAGTAGKQDWTGYVY